MKKHQKQIFALAVTLVFTATVLVLTGLSEAGKPEKPDPVMDMIEDIFDVVSDTNNRVWELGSTAPQKTGQDSCWDTSGNPINCEGTGQDGELRNGVAWPVPRFTANVDGTVTDHLTGLIWLKNANCFGTRDWASALSDANGLASGSCDLTDGSIAGDWRLPNVREFQSLIDYDNYDPALPSGHPFTGLQFWQYWSSTTYTHYSDHAWFVGMQSGWVATDRKGDVYYVWPVRDGN
jgi:hypothetical protein